MTAEGSLITDEMRATIGVTEAPVRYEVHKTGCRMFARAIGYKDRVFYDSEDARKRGYRDIIAPPAYMGTPVFEPGGSAGLPQRPAHIKRVLNAANEYEYYDVVTAGDEIEAQTTIKDMKERDGSVGRMVIVTRETTYRRLSDGKVVAKEIGTRIFY